jgi:hypothetical protein
MNKGTMESHGMLVGVTCEYKDTGFHRKGRNIGVPFE